MKRRKLESAGAAALFLLCAAMTAYYLTAGYGAYLDADMASELALARHLADEGTLISSTWLYSTEVRVLSTQLVFTPLMALLGGSWRAVRTVGCLILQAMLAASAYFCGRSLGAKKSWALVFAGLSISACSVVYSQMILIGAYYVPHAVLTNLCVGMTAQIMQLKKGGRRMGVFAALTALCALMGASSIRYPFSSRRKSLRRGRAGRRRKRRWSFSSAWSALPDLLSGRRYWVGSAHTTRRGTAASGSPRSHRQTWRR